MRRSRPEPDGTILRGDLELPRTVIEHIGQSNALVARLAEGEPAVGWLASLPGIGPFLSVLIRYEVDEMQRFQADPEKHRIAVQGFLDAGAGGYRSWDAVTPRAAKRDNIRDLAKGWRTGVHDRLGSQSIADRLVVRPEEGIAPMERRVQEVSSVALALSGDPPLVSSGQLGEP